jgi:hypothetical protein
MADAIKLRAALNRAIRCSVKGCSRKRRTGSMSSLCQTHLTHSLRYGHPEQARIEKGRILEPCLRRATAFLKTHRNDEPVLHAIEVMRDLLLPRELPSKWLSGRPKKGHGNNPSYFIGRELQRLADGGYRPQRPGRRREPKPREKMPAVTPEEALTQLSAVWLLYENEPGNFQLDGGGKTLNHAIARAIFALRTPRQTWSQGKAHSKEFPSLALNVFGQRCRDRLAPFLAQVSLVVKRKDEEERAHVEGMRRPFTDVRPSTDEPLPSTDVRSSTTVVRPSTEESAKPKPQSQEEEEAARRARAPWTPEERRAFEVECRNIGRRPEEYDARTQTNWLRKRRGLPLLPAKPPEHRPWTPPPPPVQAYQPR